MNIKILDKDLVTFSDHVMPYLRIPSSLKNGLSAKQQQVLKSVCLQEYRDAMKCLNESVADVASHDKNALAFASELAQRVLSLMEIAADLGLDQRVSETQDITKLIDIGIPECSIRSRSSGLLKELKRGNLKSAIISASGKTEAGYLGMSPLAINTAAKGNLREMMYIPYKTTREFTDTLLAKPENVDAINTELNARDCGWQINVEVINALKAQLSGNSLYQYGAYAASRDAYGGSRIARDDTYKAQYQQNNPSIQAVQQGRIPLSSRELLAQSGDLDPNSTQKVQWSPGKAWFGVRKNPDKHPSLKAADETGAVMLTGISGTTDSILTMSHFLGMFDGENKEKKMRDAMVACMGWMIDANDHTVHEIQMSAKSFGIDYTPGPASYKQIRPGDDVFEKALVAAQKKRGFDMPDDILGEAHVCEKAKELFPVSPRSQMMTAIKEALVALRPVKEESVLDENKSGPRMKGN